VPVSMTTTAESLPQFKQLLSGTADLATMLRIFRPFLCVSVRLSVTVIRVLSRNR